MKRSAGEMRAEVLKAARGAGVALGTAEDLAQASAWMSTVALEQVLEALDSDPARLDDLVLTMDAGADDASGGGALWQALLAARADAPKPQWPQDVPPSVFARLAGHAARTYVPETEASRQAGAGAGDIDND